MTVYEKPKVYFKNGYWHYAGFVSDTIPSLIAIVKQHVPYVPKEPHIFS